MSDVSESEIAEDEAPLAPPAPRKGKPVPREEVSQSAQAMTQADDRTVYEFLRDIGTGGTVKLKLIRTSPKTLPDGTLCCGSLAEYDEPFDEEEIRRLFGGGKFQVKAFRAGAKGGMNYAGARTFEIAGVPRMPGMDAPLHAPVISQDTENVPLQRQALGMMERFTSDAQKRADRLEAEMRNGNGRSTGDELRAALAPMETQIAALNQQIMNLQRIIADKDKQILDLVTRKPETTFQDRMLDKLTDNDNARITHLREEHASELRQLRQSHTDEMRVMNERYDRDIQSREKSHDRELDNLKMSHQNTIDNLKSGFESRLDTMKIRTADLDAAILLAKQEIQALRDKKDKSPLEAMEELATMKSSMEALGLVNTGGDEAPSTWERILSGVLESPLAKAVSTRIEQAPATPPPQQQQRVVVRKKPSPAATAATPDNPAAHVASTPAPVSGPPAKKPKAPEPPKLSQMDVSLAVSFMENAVNANQPPEVFAESIRSMLPKDIIEYIKMVGIDEFLKLAKIPDGTPLASQNGRNYVRKVAKVLVGE